jgi:hypothetical protein
MEENKLAAAERAPSLREIKDILTPISIGPGLKPDASIPEILARFRILRDQINKVIAEIEAFGISKA